jgi:MFS family permease
VLLHLSHSLAMGAVPSLILFFGSMLLPDTPNSLVQRGRAAKGRNVLEKIRGTDQVSVEMDDIVEAVRISAFVKNPWRTITRRRYWPQLIISILVPMFQQLTGINAIMFYAPQLFQAAGHTAESALLSTVITGAVNMGSTFVAIVLVDRIGRRVSFCSSSTAWAMTGHSKCQQQAAKAAMPADDCSAAFSCDVQHSLHCLLHSAGSQTQRRMAQSLCGSGTGMPHSLRYAGIASWVQASAPQLCTVALRSLPLS